MSTTNQPAASDNPGSTPGAIGGAREGVDPAAIARGHEADGYDTASVFSVPLMVVGFFALAFAVTTAIFWYVTTQLGADPNAHPVATARNAAPLNERMNRIHRGGEIDQPRLEPLVLREGGSENFPRKALTQGNSPQIHPEQLRVNKANTPALFRAEVVDAKQNIVRLPIDEAMKVALEKGVLKARADEVRAVGTRFSPTAANAGRGAGGSAVKSPAGANVASAKDNSLPPLPDDKQPPEKDAKKDKK